MLAHENLAETQLPHNPALTSTMTHNLACHGCGYNLLGLHMEGRCPECGAPIVIAAAGQALQFAHPQWVCKLALGATIAKYAGIGLMAIVSLSWIAKLISGESARDLLFLCGITLFAIGEWTALWFLAAPNESELPDESWRSARKCVRYALLSFPLTLAACCLPAVAVFGPRWFAIMLAGAPFGLTGFIGQQAICRRFEQIAGRIDGSAAAGTGHRYARGYSRSWPPLALGVIIALFGYPALGAFFIIPGSLGVLYFGALTVFLPTIIANELIPYAAWAKQCWASAEEYTNCGKP